MSWREFVRIPCRTDAAIFDETLCVCVIKTCFKTFLSFVGFF